MHKKESEGMKKIILSIFLIILISAVAVSVFADCGGTTGCSTTVTPTSASSSSGSSILSKINKSDNVRASEYATSYMYFNWTNIQDVQYINSLVIGVEHHEHDYANVDLQVFKDGSWNTVCALPYSSYYDETKECDITSYKNSTVKARLYITSTKSGCYTSKAEVDYVYMKLSKTEFCNGKDDDCDGQVDEGLGTTTCGLGICAHTINKCVGGVPQTCNPYQGASTEVCDAQNRDEDCDGQNNEGCSCVDGQIQRCGPETEEGVCEFGTQTCVNGQWGSCTGAVNPSTEECNGLDDDCDGAADEDNICLPHQYYCDVDSDGHYGMCSSCHCDTYNCQPPEGCTFEEGDDCDDADGNIHPPDLTSESPGLCDGKDNDCDGQTDEGCCGNNLVESWAGEECDPPYDCTPGYEGSCLLCTSECKNLTIFDGSCGDGVINEPDEECDPGIGGDWSCCGYVDEMDQCKFKPSTQICRGERSGGCDVAEYCSGSSDICPDDVYQPQRTHCDDETVCDGSEICDGQGNCQEGTPLECETCQTCDSQQGCIAGGGCMDYGDAPDSYNTTSGNGGASHAQSDLYLGSNIDIESDGQPSSGASDDDNDGVDDGVVFTSTLTQGQTAAVTVTSSGSGYINAWIDFNKDGDWDDEGEQIFVDMPVGPGQNTLSFSVPAGAVPGNTYARFRLNSAGGLSYTGTATDGEVEDYLVAISKKLSDEPIPEFSTIAIAGVLIAALSVFLIMNMKK